MKRALLATTLFALVMTRASGQAGADQSSLRKTLFALSDKFMVEWQKHDMAGLGALLAPEFVYVGPHGTMPRAVVLSDLGTHCTLASYKFGEPQMIETSPDSAALIYTIHQDVTCFGQPVEPEVVNTDTFVKRGGKWLFVMTTSTPLVQHP